MIGNRFPFSIHLHLKAIVYRANLALLVSEKVVERTTWFFGITNLRTPFPYPFDRGFNPGDRLVTSLLLLLGVARSQVRFINQLLVLKVCDGVEDPLYFNEPLPLDKPAAALSALKSNS